MWYFTTHRDEVFDFDADLNLCHSYLQGDEYDVFWLICWPKPAWLVLTDRWRWCVCLFAELNLRNWCVQTDEDDVFNSFADLNLGKSLVTQIKATGFYEPSVFQKRAIIPCLRGKIKMTLFNFFWKWSPFLIHPPPFFFYKIFYFIINHMIGPDFLKRKVKLAMSHPTPAICQVTLALICLKGKIPSAGKSLTFIVPFLTSQ